jgi:hypothetical protein
LSYSENYDPADPSSRTVCKDVSEMSEEDLGKILDKLEQELHPDDEE